MQSSEVEDHRERGDKSGYKRDKREMMKGNKKGVKKPHRKPIKIKKKTESDFAGPRGCSENDH